MDYYIYDPDYNNADDYDSQNLEDYIDEATFRDEGNQSFTETYETCIMPSVKQIFNYIAVIVGWSLLFRVICLVVKWRQGRYDWVKHTLTMFCGFAVLYGTIGKEMLVIVLLAILAYVLMLLVHYFKIKHSGVVIALTTVGLHFFYELFWDTPETWQRIRGTQMIATMKIISLAYDIEGISDKKKSTQSPGLILYLGYIFCPATCVLGPWIPYSAYIQSLQSNGSHKYWVMWIIFNVFAAIIFLSLSNCVAPMISSNRSWVWLQTFLDALAVRASHYFICFLSQASICAGNINLNCKLNNNIAFGPMITKPWNIEFARSLNFMVRNWNIPMHNWLKAYVFKSTHRISNSYLIAILGTYLVSSLLHGMHFRIYLVLMSLALFAYVESVLRFKCAQIFNACVTSNPCKSSCHYAHCISHGISMNALITILVNFIFSLLCSIHLAYLGIMLSTNGNEKEDLSLRLGLNRWAQLSYLNHWIALGMYIFYRII